PAQPPPFLFAAFALVVPGVAALLEGAPAVRPVPSVVAVRLAPLADSSVHSLRFPTNLLVFRNDLETGDLCLEIGDTTFDDDELTTQVAGLADDVLPHRIVGGLREFPSGLFPLGEFAVASGQRPV